MCIMICFWSGLKVKEGYLHPKNKQVRNWGYLGKPSRHRLTSLDVANWGVRDHYGFPSLQRLTSFFAWFEEDAPALAAKVRGWIHRHHANIQVLATILLKELRQYDEVFLTALLEMKVLYELPQPAQGLAKPLGSIMDCPSWELIPLNDVDAEDI